MAGIPIRDGELPEIFVLDSECLMAGEFGVLFAMGQILASGDSLDLGLNPEACVRQMLAEPAAREAFSAFIEKRRPDFQQL